MKDAPLHQPLIFIGPPRAGVSFISDIVFHHEALCWLDENFEKHPDSYFQHKLFHFTSKFRSFVPKSAPSSLLHYFAKELAPTPSEALSFWDDITHEDIDFFRGFAWKQHASPIEIAVIREILSKRVRISKKQKLSLRFTGPSKIKWLKSIFPDAQFVQVIRDPAATVHSIISTQMWEYQGKHMLWWRGAYSEEDLAQYDALRGDAVASTAFQLNKLLQTTQQEALELKIDMLQVNYEDFITNPKETLNTIFSYAHLPDDERVHCALSKKEIKNSNKVLTMPNADINTVYTWCPSSSYIK